MYRFLLLSILSGCSFQPALKITYAAPELIQGTVIQYVAEFNQYCPNDRKTPFIVIVSTLPETASATAAGHCTLIPGGVVYLKLDSWLRYSPMQRRALVAHEMAHCELGKYHDQNSWLMRGDGVTEEELQGKTIEDVYAAACPD